ncbi:MAG: DUF2975 domain-containing protein [Gammaproteobacteria bacterium]|jgi:hypothetical protein|nr:DUF2975 domain-containing protein [Gammaproteobacteria bacterium]
MQNQRIKVMSHRFRILFQVLFYLTPLIVCLNWSNVSLWLQCAHIDTQPFNTSLFTLPLSSRIGAIFVSMISASFWMMALYYLIQLFKLYEQNKIFTDKNVFYFRKIGIALFSEVVARFLSEPLLALAVTFHNPPGQRMIAISFGVPDFYALVFSGIVILIAWVMHEGKQLKEETELTV